MLIKEVGEADSECVVVLNHTGFDVDKNMAWIAPGIDVILSGHTHDSLPEPTLVGQTIIIPSGSNEKFVSRIDLNNRGSETNGYSTMKTIKASTLLACR